MKLYYSHCKNFGDALNPWLWPQLLPRMLGQDDELLLVGIGTLLNDKVPANAVKIVFGSGVGYGNSLPHLDERWRIYCVRGPVSAMRLGIDPALAITDGAALLRMIDLP